VQRGGDDGVQLLRGMFACAIWDAAAAAASRPGQLGKKPLYYTRAGGSQFCVEAKALFVRAGVPAAPNLDALDLYLTFQYVPGPSTLFKDVHKLPPGHVLTVEDGRVSIRRYWDTVFGQAERGVDLDEASEEFRQIFSESVRLHLGSDVPVGVLLSGGIDSSAVVGAMAEVSGPSARLRSGSTSRGTAGGRAAVANHFGTGTTRSSSPDVAELLRSSCGLDEPSPTPPRADVPALPICASTRARRPHRRRRRQCWAAIHLCGSSSRSVSNARCRRPPAGPCSLRSACCHSIAAPEGLLACLARRTMRRGTCDGSGTSIGAEGAGHFAGTAGARQPGSTRRSSPAWARDPRSRVTRRGSIHRLIGLDVHTWLADDILQRWTR
jgi:hypothetical protein